MIYLKRNLPTWERAARLGGAAALAAAASLLAGPLAWAAAGAAAMMAVTAVAGFCPACALFGRRPARG
jgi:hypothetical protein